MGELTEPANECDADGNLNKDAVGWSRRPLHTCNPRGHHLLPARRWDHWWVVTPRAAFAVTVADFEYVRVGAVTLFDFQAGKQHFHRATTWAPLVMPDRPGGGRVLFHHGAVLIDIQEPAANKSPAPCASPPATRIVVGADTNQAPSITADLSIVRPPGQESLNVLVPFKRKNTYAFTSKQVGLPATGALSCDGTAFDLGGAAATLDFGRGVWLPKVAWNWAAGSGKQARGHIALQLGAQWTDGSGQTENGFFLDGILHKIHEELRVSYDPKDLMKPWTIKPRDAGPADRLSLTFRPIMASKKVILTTRLHLCFGHFEGWVRSDSGERIEIRDLFGWAEDFAGLW
jgi:hypothetical protein